NPSGRSLSQMRCVVIPKPPRNRSATSRSRTDSRWTKRFFSRGRPKQRLRSAAQRLTGGDVSKLPIFTIMALRDCLARHCCHSRPLTRYDWVRLTLRNGSRQSKSKDQEAQEKFFTWQRSCTRKFQAVSIVPVY